MSTIQKIFNHNGRDVFLLAINKIAELEETIDFPKPFFHATIFLEDNEINDYGELKNSLKQLLDLGARNFVCAGSAGEKVHDLVDNFRESGNYEKGIDECISTTWHKNDSLNEVVQFSLNDAFSSDNFEEFNPPKVFIVLKSSSIFKELNKILFSQQ